jgi:hypothetical protein
VLAFYELVLIKQLLQLSIMMRDTLYVLLTTNVVVIESTVILMNQRCFMPVRKSERKQINFQVHGWGSGLRYKQCWVTAPVNSLQVLSWCQLWGQLQVCRGDVRRTKVERAGFVWSFERD